MIFRLSVGNKHDAPEGRKLIESFYSEDKHYLLMDRAYEDNETRELAVKQGFVPVVPPKRNRKNPWEYDKELYKCSLSRKTQKIDTQNAKIPFETP